MLTKVSNIDQHIKLFEIVVMKYCLKHINILLIIRRWKQTKLALVLKYLSKEMQPCLQFLEKTLECNINIKLTKLRFLMRNSETLVFQKQYRLLQVLRKKVLIISWEWCWWLPQFREPRLGFSLLFVLACSSPM